MKEWAGHSALTKSSQGRAEPSRADPIGEAPETGPPGLISASRGWVQGPRALCGLHTLSMRLEWGQGGDLEGCRGGV